MDMDFLLSLLTIIGIDIVLGGDNAIVVALACRNLPKEIRNKAIVLGIGLALITRMCLTLVAVQLLEIPFLLAISGALLIYIAYSLLTDHADDRNIEGGTNLWSAIKAIIIADLVMGFDNVIAVAGAAHGDTLLVMLGLIISVPIIIWGSKLILRAFDRFPIIVYFGAGILAFTASRMITHEVMLAPLFSQHPLFTFLFKVIIIAGVIIAGIIRVKWAKAQ
ncbi:TerC family protein [Halalkalibacter krulwichiae]|uniref:Integral membrane protein TerC family protein n=1 Tax=Halalkalibacter krulwichiae TaxID=199441 RepID=A0A1X9ML39_9BACI|nr:TerC family protein [Halalkalibacter krulwichiae]ARK31462.1 Integral membrane protein TerC family protein [Halalkalibacter krulwichiae]